MFIWPLTGRIYTNSKKEGALGLDHFLLQFVSIKRVFLFRAELTFRIIGCDDHGAVCVMFVE